MQLRRPYCCLTCFLLPEGLHDLHGASGVLDTQYALIWESKYESRCLAYSSLIFNYLRGLGLQVAANSCKFVSENATNAQLSTPRAAPSLISETAAFRTAWRCPFNCGL